MAMNPSARLIPSSGLWSLGHVWLRLRWRRGVGRGPLGTEAVY